MDLHNSAMHSGKATELDKDILGMPKGSENLSSTTSSSKTSVSLRSMSYNTRKRSRASYQSTQTSRCQVEGCNLDLESAKDYHRRHRICESHSKSPKAIVAGVEQRFHNLSEFDDKKRSCRRRLSDHNARRRRPQPDAMHICSMGLSSSVYDRRLPSYLLNKMTSSSSSTTWEGSSCLKMAQDGNSLIRTSDYQEFTRNFTFADRHGINASVANSHPHLNEVQSIPSALSLLSTTTWALNEPESTSLEQLMQGSVGIAQPAMVLESQNWPLISAEQAPSFTSPLHSMASQSTTDTSHFRDLQSFKPPYEPGFHFSGRIN
ncbi:hypothetical protein ACH5RR_003474 [Cinchona calisaya]|uniref:SBP-type domain-containing protein n=1 Tax=Cinchona calisaya TaxID=153742 RepID=A0ABD3AUX3_9GENT